MPLPAPGETVGGYVLTEASGSGGMGVVFRARDPELERDVAVKLIAPELSRDPGFRSLFIRESLAAAALEHPHVIPVYRAGEDGGRLFIAMRFVDGDNLADLISRRGRLAPSLAVLLATHVASALDAAHARGLVHRDVKPGNILVAGDDGEEIAYLTDFGLAVGADREDPTGGWVGTVSYLAPEQITGGTIDGRSDVYALGCVLFHALTGRVPFPGDDRESVIVAHLTAPPPSVTEVAAGVPRGFDAVVQRAMAKDPEARYAGAREFADALRALRFDVFLAHGPQTDGFAQHLATALAARGLDVGRSADGLDALRASAACAVLVGADGLGEWAADTLAVCGDMAAHDRTFRIAGVLAPGAADLGTLPAPALAGHPWADARGGHPDDDLDAILRVLGLDPVPVPSGDGDDVCPYRGLVAFDTEDAAVFVGREQEVDALVHHLREARFLMVLGPSGSGKSSLVGAGLVPAVLDGGLPGSWAVVRATPGSRPARSLEAAVAAAGCGRIAANDILGGVSALHEALMKGPDDDRRVLVVVDQLEELFALCDDAVERRAVIDALLYAATVPGGRTTVVTCMRADFYGHCAAHDQLRAMVADHQFLVGSMTPAALRRAIEVPARRAGLRLEPGLARRIIEDVADRPGTLPLVQHLMVELWHRRTAGELTLQAYASSGGVEGALARRADAVLDDLTPERRDIARRVMLRLTQPGAGTENTRRRATMRELTTQGDDPGEVQAVVARLVDARLVTTGSDPDGAPVVEVAHEALLRAWPRLREWIEEGREALRRQHRLTQAADDWERSGRDDGHLLSGSLLTLWTENDQSGLTDLERAFIAAGLDRRDQAQRAARRRTRLAMGALAAGIAVLGAAGGYALVQRNDAQGERDRAQSQRLAVSSREQVALNPELALLLAQEAMQADTTPEAEQAIRQAVAESHLRGTFRGHESSVYDAAVSADGWRTVSGSQDGTIRVWDTRSAAQERVIDMGEGPYGVLALSLSDDGATIAATLPDTTGIGVVDADTGAIRHRLPVAAPYAVGITRDGTRVAAADSDGVIGEWDARTGRRLRTIGTHPGGVNQVALTPDGRWVTGGGGGIVRVWPRDAAGRAQVYRSPSASLNDTMVSPDGRRIAATAFGSPARVFVWDTARPARAPRQLSGKSAIDNGVSFSPDSRWLAVSSDDGRVRFVRVGGGRTELELRGHDSLLFRARFVPGGGILSVSNDGTLKRWSWTDGIPDRAPIVVPGAAASVTGPQLRFDPDRRVTALDSYGGVWRWRPGRDTPVAVQGRAAGPLNDVVLVGSRRLIWTEAFTYTLHVEPARAPRAPIVIPKAGSDWQGLGASADGTRAAAAALDGMIVEWDLTAGGRPTTVSAPGSFNMIGLAMSGAGTYIAAGSLEGPIRLWGPDRGEPRVLEAHTASTTLFAFSPDERYLVTGSEDRSVRVWETATGRMVAVLLGHPSLSSVAFDAGGDRVVSAGTDGVRVWDWRRETQIASFTDEPQPSAVAISPDGTRIVGLGADMTRQTLTVWRCTVCGPFSNVQALAAGRTTRELTPIERRQFAID